MLTKIIILLAMIPASYVLIALGLIASQWPSQLPSNRQSLDFSGVLASSSTLPKDKRTMEFRRCALPICSPTQSNLIVLLHGSGWHGMQFEQLAQSLAKHAWVAVPELRGHGLSPERRGDVDHIGQLEEDVADLVDQLKDDTHRVTVVGHSSGGGLVVRMAGGIYRDRMDKAVLLAPFLQYDAPTVRPNSGGWAKPLRRRLVGISMLNNVGISAFNGMTVIQFAMPEAVIVGPLGHTATTAYSFRMNQGYGPRRDYLKDVAQLPPFLLIVGSMDEAFVADQFQEVLGQASQNGTYQIFEGLGHLDIVNDERTANYIIEHLLRE